MTDRNRKGTTDKRRWPALTALCLAVTAASGDAVWAVQHVEFVRDGVTQRVQGEVLVEAQDGGLLLRSPTGVLWILQPDEIKRRASDDAPFEMLDSKQVAADLLEELGEEFKIHTTANYVVAYNTSQAYAQWCGALYERLFRAFQTYWKSKGLELDSPDGPLVALVFDTREAFQAHARRDLGVDPGGMIGYYNVRTNRVNMYDLTGVSLNSAARINQVLMQPQAERTVATIVHEATHQLAYNTGLQTRYADNPFWVSEGLAVFFETPDLRSKSGWRGIGEVNRVNLAQFRRYVRQRPADSLATLLSDDARFRDGKTSADAYAEAWALNYFLLRRHGERYTQYLSKLAERTPLIELDGQQRLDEFVATFGPLAEFDREFLRYMTRIR